MGYESHSEKRRKMKERKRKKERREIPRKLHGVVP